MNRQDIIRMVKEAGDADRIDPFTKDGDWVILTPDEIVRFANIVASAERERIKQANAPEIEHINAHIKELEDAVLVEREACAKIADIAEPYKSADLIRARGQA